MMTAEERFWDKVHCEPNTGCWLWAGAEKGGGYGSFHYLDKSWYAHRASYEMHIGPIPDDGRCILHKCDVKLCVNPEHLYVGTRSDNVRDALDRGLHPVGERHGLSKLTERDVREIRDLRGRFSQRSLSAQYGISQTHIRRIFDGERWAHVLTYDYCELPGDDDGE